MSRIQSGQVAAPFELQDTTGKVRRLGDFAGQYLLLVFHRHLA